MGRGATAHTGVAAPPAAAPRAGVDSDEGCTV